jgi:hypothetical protein
VPRGGKREGAGRPAGLPSVKTKRRIEAVEKALADGIDPLNVMLDNMRHFHKLALSAEGVLSELFAEAVKNMNRKSSSLLVGGCKPAVSDHIRRKNGCEFPGLRHGSPFTRRQTSTTDRSRAWTNKVL